LDEGMISAVHKWATRVRAPSGFHCHFVVVKK
jgi:hypothetical protein